MTTALHVALLIGLGLASTGAYLMAWRQLPSKEDDQPWSEAVESREPINELAIQLDELIADVCALLAVQADGAGVALSFSATHGAIRVDVDELRASIASAVCGAIEVTPRGGLVAISHRIDPTGARIVIRDDGREVGTVTTIALPLEPRERPQAAA